MSRRRPGLLGLLFVGLAMACGPAASGTRATAPATPGDVATGAAVEPGQAAPTALRIAAVNPLALYWDLYAAVEQGYLRQQGIDLEIIYTASTPRSAQLLVTGEVELGTIGADTAVETIVKGADLRIVAGGARHPNYVLATQPAIRQYSDLRGKTLAVTGPALADAVFLRKLLERHGLSPDDYDVITIGGTAERYAALKSGAIAGTLLTQPVDFQAQDDGLNLLGTSHEVIQDYQFVTTTVRREWAERNRALLVRFIRALRAADQWLYQPQNESRAVEILVRHTNTREDYARRSYELYYRQARSMPEDASLSLPGLANVIQIMREQGRLEEPLPAVERFVDTSYWMAAGQ